MKRKNLFLFLLVSFLMPASAFAAAIEADIVRLDRDNSILILSPIEPQSHGREVRVTLKEIREYWGVNQLSDLEKGRVVVEVQDSTPEVWTVQSLELMKTRVEGDTITYYRDVDVVKLPAKTYEVVIERDMPHDAGNPKYENLGRRGTETYKVKQPAAYVSETPGTERRTTTTTTTTQRIV